MMRTLVMLLLAGSTVLPAQERDTSSMSAGDSVLARARQLVNDGSDAESRQLLDSLLEANTPDSAIYSDALYWRAALAPTAADAERDYRRLLIEVPLSARAEDALLQLAQLEQSRGDRRGAADHLQRFLLSYANSAARPRVALSLARLLFDLGPQEQAHACEALRAGRASVPAENAELRNQLDFYAPRCVGFEVATGRAPPSATPDSLPQPRDAGSPAADAADAADAPVVRDIRPTDTAAASAEHVAPAAPATPAAPAAAPRERPVRASRPKSGSTTFYSVQVAAYDGADAAHKLVKRLSAQGLLARVDGTAAPFRVRVGRYRERAAAVKARASLRAKGYPEAFIAIVRGK